jgi:hypothetical protein
MRNRRGGIALATALAAIPLIAAAGLAIDGARAWLVSSRLQASLDAAALAGARNLNVTRTARDAEIRAMFWANFSAAIPDPLMPDRRLGFLGSSTETPVIRDRTDNPLLPDTAIEISVAAVVPTTFMRIFGIDSVRVAASAQARRADLGMELALVLDVTGSMGRNYRPNSSGLRDFDVTRNIHALRLAAQDLVNILYGNRTVVDGLWVSIVPYTTTVNIGASRSHLVDFSRIAASTQNGRTTFGFSGLNAYGPAGWGGCIEARHLDRSLEEYEAPPVASLLTPFFWHSTLRNDGTMQRRAGTNTLMPGDNDWIRQLAGPGGSNSPFAITERWRAARENFSVGPNLGCPEDEILPLEANRDVILDRLQGLRSTFRGGTMANIGLQAGLWTLSPLWRDIWSLGPPPPGQDTSLPLDYGAPFMRKVIVLMTDGENQWFDFPQGWPGRCDDTNATDNRPRSGLNRLPGVANVNIPPFSTQPCPSGYTREGDGQNDADYTGYGRLRDNRLGTNLTNAQANAILNERMLELCNAIKSRGITIYTITFNLTNVNTQNLFRSCATSPDFYFDSPTQQDLRAAFQTIGSQLANLRLTQ